MSEKGLAGTLIDLLEPIASEHGFELVTVEIAGADHMPIVRVFLDREQGINLDAVAGTNEWVSEALDEFDGLSGPYTLEVSSPGIERALRTREHFVRFVNSRAKVKTSRPIDGRSAFTGTITAIDGDDVVMDCEGTTCRIPLDAVRKANLKVDIDFGNDKGVPQ
ncbi:MAG: ribosome maturation factor RimP [Coriobacteriia bacterium]|nr:ribosome maturation factor RimP [Coriobacteriia bacterium]MBN2822788.1 ribosome maturation factor RimP [Coriobacteriia bacterium]